MNLADILGKLPPRVYLRCGELVIQFPTPTWSLGSPKLRLLFQG